MSTTSTVERVAGMFRTCPTTGLKVHKDADSLIKLADDRLYAAKAAGRNRIFIESSAPELIP